MNKMIVCAGLVMSLLTGCANQTPTVGQTGAAPLTGEAAEALKLAHLLRDNGSYKAAYEVYRKMDEKQELRGAYLLEYASVAGLVIPPSKVIALYGRAKQSLPSPLQDEQQEAIGLGLGRAYLQLTQRDQAKAYFEQVLKVSPDNVSALNCLSVIASYTGDTMQARQLLQQALDRDPENVMVLNNLAMTYLVNGDTHRTIELLRARQTTLPLSGKLNLALAYILNERTDLARKLLNTALPTDKTERAITQFEHLRQRVHQGQPLAGEIAALSQVPVQLAEDE